VVSVNENKSRCCRDVVHVDFELIDVATEYDDHDYRWWGVVAGEDKTIQSRDSEYNHSTA